MSDKPSSSIHLEPFLSSRQRLARSWEEQKHLLPDGELKQFLCALVMEKMEEWAGNEPPKQKPLTVELVSQENCDHEFKKHICQRCGLQLYTEDEDFPSFPQHISPFYGGWN